MDGRTPNPCVKCNSYVKWGNLIEQANKFGAYYIATGHYARINRQNKEPIIQMAKDKSKDQSYMLWHINRELIDRTLFPIGEFTKDEIRAYAKEQNLETSDSCFNIVYSSVLVTKLLSSELSSPPAPWSTTVNAI